MRIIQNKEEMISYYQQTKIENKDIPKIGRKLSKLAKNSKKLVKNWYYVHFDTKKYIKNSKMRVIQNKEDMISYCNLKKIKKKKQGRPKTRPKLGQKFSKMRKIEKIW